MLLHADHVVTSLLFDAGLLLLNLRRLSHPELVVWVNRHIRDKWLSMSYVVLQINRLSCTETILCGQHDLSMAGTVVRSSSGLGALAHQCYLSTVNSPSAAIDC